MKRLVGLMLAVGLSISAMAQSVKAPHVYHPRVTVVHVAPVVRYPFYGAGLGFVYGFAPYGYYSPMWDYPRVIETTPSQLSLKLDEINYDYQFQIKTARHDKSLAKQDRKQKIRDLKHERDNAVIEAKKEFYKSPANS